MPIDHLDYELQDQTIQDHGIKLENFVVMFLLLEINGNGRILDMVEKDRKSVV